jgi:hypothetical protein
MATTRTGMILLIGPLSGFVRYDASTKGGQRRGKERAISVPVGRSCRQGREVGYHAEVVTPPDAVDWFVEDALAGAHVEGRPVLDAAHEYVVDPAA